MNKMNSNDHFFLAYLFDSMRSALCSLRLSVNYLTRIPKLGLSAKLMVYGISSYYVMKWLGESAFKFPLITFS